MNSFETKVSGFTGGYLHSSGIDAFQVNVGFKCNQRCRHCHIQASPDRREEMSWETMELVIGAVLESGCGLVDITGGSPELNPNLKRFIEALAGEGLDIQVRTNLTVMLEPGQEDTAEFFREYGVGLVASLPYYAREIVNSQRGKGVYEKSIAVLRRLNGMGYGIEQDLPLTLIYNPGGFFLPPDQSTLEADYRRELKKKSDIRFTRLQTITNMPIGRFKSELSGNNRQMEYQRLLECSFNPATIDLLMCRRQISVSWDGTLHDCDFNLALGLPLNHGAPDHIEKFDVKAVSNRRIVTGRHCFACTAGAGSS